MPSFPARPHRVVVVAFPGVLLLDLAGPVQVFHAAGGYDVRVVSARGGMVPSDVGLGLETRPWDDGPIGTLLLPGGHGVEQAGRGPEMIGWLRAAAARAERVASVCLGAFLLAEAGLLDGCRATTHWGYCAALAARYPAVRVQAEPIFVCDGRVWTSAGVSTGIDLALALVEEDQGHAAALEVAQRLVVYLKRPGGQAQFSRALALQSADRAGRFAALAGWMAEHLDADLRVEALAERAGMAPRSFARAWAEQTGTTPARAVEALRVEAARRMLAGQPDVTVAVIAQRCGFGDDERMRRAFLRMVGVAPAEWRARFGAEHAPQQGGTPHAEPGRETAAEGPVAAAAGELRGRQMGRGR